MDIINILDTTNIINSSPNNNVIVEIPTVSTITSGLTGAPGPKGDSGSPGLPGSKGDMGPSGETTMAGIGIVFSTLGAGDLLAYNGINWTNATVGTLTEGGNF